MINTETDKAAAGAISRHAMSVADFDFSAPCDVDFDDIWGLVLNCRSLDVIFGLEDGDTFRWRTMQKKQSVFQILDNQDY